jgi:hypothetical protein
VNTSKRCNETNHIFIGLGTLRSIATRRESCIPRGFEDVIEFCKNELCKTELCESDCCKSKFCQTEICRTQVWETASCVT